MNRSMLATLCLGLLIALGGCATTGSRPKEPVKGASIVIKDARGHQHPAYVAGPATAAAGVLVVHDYFGISAFTRATVERLGAQGYRALAIDLYGGKSATTHEPAVALMQGYMQQELAVRDTALQAGVDALKVPGRRLAALGFSMGAAESVRAALNDPAAVRAAVAVYGFGLEALAREQPRAQDTRVMSITGALDDGSLQSSIYFLKSSSTHGPSVELHVLPGVGHAFAQPLFNGGKGYDARATSAMWEVVDLFLARHLKAPE